MNFNHPSVSVPSKTVNKTVMLSLNTLSKHPFQKKYIGGAGLGKCQSDDKFWLNFYKWSERKYGARGPTDLEWHEIMDEHEE